MNRSFIHTSTNPTMSLPAFTATQRHRSQSTSDSPQPITLPSDVGWTVKQNFIPRMLFTDMYWAVLPYKWSCVCLVHFMYYFCCAVTQVCLSFCAIKNYLLTYMLYYKPPSSPCAKICRCWTAPTRLPLNFCTESSMVSTERSMLMTGVQGLWQG